MAPPPVVSRNLAGAWLGSAGGETVGVSSQYTFGTALIWAGVVALLLYVLYRRFG